MILDTDRERFVEHVSGEPEGNGRDEQDAGPVVVRVSASLDVTIDPLAAYAALSGYQDGAGGTDGTDRTDRGERSERNAESEGAGYSFLL